MGLLKNYGVKDSWTKLYVRVPWDGSVAISYLRHPIALSEKDKTLLALQRQEELIVRYDIENEMLVEKVKKNVQDYLSEFSHISRVLKVYKCVPSIVPVPHSGEKKKDKGMTKIGEV